MSNEIPVIALPLKKAVDDMYDSAKGSVKKRFKKYVTNKNIKHIYDHLRSIGKVRTIWQTDKPVPIKSFYSHQKIIIEDKSLSIKKLSDLTKVSNRTIVQGIVGQGKSIFLRYLCIEELKKLSSIPVFLELRKFIKEKTLIEQISEYLGDIGIDSTKETFNYLATNNKIDIFLDAYDELDESIEKKVFKEIESLCRKYPKLVVIITSRQDYGIQNSEMFTITSIAPLEDSDLKPILCKLCADHESANEIYRGVNKSGGSVKSLLTTPLMVTLMVFVYKSDQKIPMKPIEFYDSLFSTVLSRHDKQKPGGVNRTRKTKVSDVVFQKIALDPKSSMTEVEITSYIEQAAEYCGETFHAEDYLDEMCKITCMILKDGFDYNYLHKSIQEYHAARFIASIPETRIIEFYNSIIDGAWHRWREQLHFLIELDGYRYYKYFVVSSCDQIRDIYFNKEGKIKFNIVSAILKDSTID